MANVKTLGEFVREQRNTLDISLRELARRIKITPPFLSDIELGKRYPSEETLAALAQEFGIKIAELKKFDHRESLSDFKRLVEENPELGFAFRAAMDKVKAGKLSGKQLAGLLTESTKKTK